MGVLLFLGEKGGQATRGSKREGVGKTGQGGGRETRVTEWVVWGSARPGDLSRAVCAEYSDVT